VASYNGDQTTLDRRHDDLYRAARLLWRFISDLKPRRGQGLGEVLRLR